MAGTAHDGGGGPEPATPPSRPARLPPLAESNSLLDLPVAGYLPALVSVPLGATAPRPVLVATHGAGGRPDGQCELWRNIVGQRAFVLCPRGKPTSVFDPADARGYYYPAHPVLGQELSAALEALQSRYRDYVDLRAPIFAGFSQGASMGALVLPEHPARFARVALVEGGFGLYQEWNLAVAERLRSQGAERVLWACGRPSCIEQARKSARLVERAGIAVKLVYVPTAGHSYRGDMARELAAAFAWLAAGDPRFDLSLPEN